GRGHRLSSFHLLMLRPPARPPLFPYTTLFRSQGSEPWPEEERRQDGRGDVPPPIPGRSRQPPRVRRVDTVGRRAGGTPWYWRRQDRKSTRLNSSHRTISYAVFCLKKKNT